MIYRAWYFGVHMFSDLFYYHLIGVSYPCVGDVHMIEGDVILQGQGTESQKMIPVMAEPPQTESDLLLVDWLDKIKYKTNKGIKLDFSSMDAVEISLQRLKEAHFQVPRGFYACFSKPHYITR